MKISAMMLATAALCAMGTAGAVDLKSAQKVVGNPAGATSGQNVGNALSGALGGGSLPTIGADVGGNVAGVLQYCIKNNYLKADAASTVKNKLLGTVTGQEEEIQQGEQGLLTGSDGKTLDFKSVPDKVRRKGCDYVLSNAKSLI